MSSTLVRPIPVRAPVVSWGAVIAGALLTVAIEVVFAVLGAAVGLGTLGPSGDAPDAGALGIGAGLWWVISSTVALFFGAAAAARLASVATGGDGVLHGLLVWGGTLLLTIYLLTSAVGGLLGGAFRVIGGTVSAAGSAIGATGAAVGSGLHAVLPQIENVTGTSPDALGAQAEKLLASPTPADPATMDRADAVKAVAEALPDLVAGGGAASDAARARIVAVVAAQAHVTPDEAEHRLDAALQQATAVKNKALADAREAATASAAAASHAAFVATAAMLIGAVTAAVGGAIGRRRSV